MIDAPASTGEATSSQQGAAGDKAAQTAAPSPADAPVPADKAVAGPIAPEDARDAGPVDESDVSLPPATPYSQAEHRALAVFAAIGFVAMLWVARPLGIGLLLGMLSAFTMQPLYRRLRAHTPERPDVAAILCVLIAAVTLFGGASLLGYLVVRRGMQASSTIASLFGPHGAAQAAASQIAVRLRPLHIAPADISARVSIAGSIAGAMFSAMLTLFFVLITLHFTLGRWKELVRHLENLSPLHPRHSHALLEEFRVVGRTVLLGTVVTGLAQGLLAAFGYWITGVPEAALLGTATAVASLVPVVGTVVIWVPAAVFLIATGHVGMGIAQLIYGSAIVVGLSDYFIRPKLVGRHGSMPTLVTFVSLFGGIEVFGVVGLILGPVIMALAMSVLRTYEREVSQRRLG